MDIGGEGKEHHVGENEASECEGSQDNEEDRDRVTDILSPIKEPDSLISFTFSGNGDKCERVYHSTKQFEEGDVEHAHKDVNTIKLRDDSLHSQ